MRLTPFFTYALCGGLCAASLARAEQPAPQAPANTQPSSTPAGPPGPLDGFLRVYGILNARIVASDSATESFSQPNAVAITAAGNPVFSVDPASSRYSFQVAQTRFGLWVNEKGSAFHGQLEMDFVDFTKATPTVASLARLRIARVDWVPAEGHMVSLGQDWDLHSPVNVPHINLVGNLFQAGNSGFMRQQLRYIYSLGEVEAAVAVGFPFNNNTNKEATGELYTLPTLAARAAWRPGGKGRVGVSAIATSLPFSPNTPNERDSLAMSVTGFADVTLGAGTQVRAELNWGQNSANLGLLTLAQGNTAGDVTEAGGFVHIRQPLSEQHAVYGMLGTQRVLDGTVVPSYSVPTGGNGAPDPANAQLAGTGPGIRNNSTARLGYEFKPLPQLALVLEGFGFRTRHVLQAADVERGVDPVQVALGFEGGAMLTF